MPPGVVGPINRRRRPQPVPLAGSVDIVVRQNAGLAAAPATPQKPSVVYDEIAGTTCSCLIKRKLRGVIPGADGGARAHVLRPVALESLIRAAG